jgi:SEC-C motif domain protein
MKRPATTTNACPCGGASYANCCQPYHLGAVAPNAERLMRSRYSAYVQQNHDYLLATWHPDTRPSSLDLTTPSIQWLSLNIKHSQTITPQQASVEFIAKYKINGRAERMHEISQFRKVDERWLYVDGQFVED